MNAQQFEEAMRRAHDAGDNAAVAYFQALAKHGGWNDFASGAEHGLRGVGKSVRRIAGSVLPGMDKYAPSDIELQRFQEEPAMQTKAGQLGDIAGSTAATLPVGAGAGAALRGLGAGAKAAGLARVGKSLSSTPVVGALEGAVQGKLSSPDEEKSDEMALSSAGLGAAAGVGTAALRKIGRGSDQVLPEARALRSRGVDLTVGQSMRPESALSKIEAASTSTPIAGPGITADRTAARQQWQDLVMGTTAPPGGAVPPRAAGDIPERLQSTYDQFRQPYQQAVAGKSVLPMTGQGKLPSLFSEAVADPNVLATAEQRGAVQRFLDNQLSLLPKEAIPNAPGGVPSSAWKTLMTEKVPAETVQAMRENVRRAAREAAGQGDVKSAMLLSNAEKQLSETLESQLPRSSTDLLRKTDRQYARYKTVETAQEKAQDQPGGFTPANLSRSVREYLTPGQRARGYGGELRGLARAGRRTLDERAPMTGARMLTVGGPLSPTPYFSSLLNSGPVKKGMLGEYKLQKLFRLLDDQLKLGPIGSTASGTAGQLGAREDEYKW